jgi:hypothetical protein
MALFRYPLPEPRGILSHHVALRFLFSEMARLISLHEWLHGIDDTPLTFCAAWLPFVSSIQAFPFALVSLDLPVYEYGGLLHAFLSRRVHIDPQELVSGVHFGSSERIEADGLPELPLASVARGNLQIERRGVSCPSRAGRRLSDII